MKRVIVLLVVLLVFAGCQYMDVNPFPGEWRNDDGTLYEFRSDMTMTIWWDVFADREVWIRLADASYAYNKTTDTLYLYYYDREGRSVIDYEFSMEHTRLEMWPQGGTPFAMVRVIPAWEEEADDE